MYSVALGARAAMCMAQQLIEFVRARSSKANRKTKYHVTMLVWFRKYPPNLSARGATFRAHKLTESVRSRSSEMNSKTKYHVTNFIIFWMYLRELCVRGATCTAQKLTDSARQSVQVECAEISKPRSKTKAKFPKYNFRERLC